MGAEYHHMYYKNPFINFIEYLFILFTILQGNSVYFCHSKLPIIIIWLILLFIMFGYTVNINFNAIELFILFFIGSSIILSVYYFYYKFEGIYVFVFAIDPSLLIAYFYVICKRNINKLSLFFKFEDIMYILAIISLICYLVYSLTKYPGNFSLSYQWGGMQRFSGYFGLYFFSAIKYNFMGISFPLRNTSIFTEAPVFSYLLTISLFINIFLVNKSDTTLKKHVKFYVLLVAIFLTFSTNGIILSILAIIFKNMTVHGKNIKKFVLLCCTPIILYLIKVVFNSKKNLDSLDVNSSYNVRHEDLLASLHAWYMHPLFGNGIGNNVPIDMHLNPLRFLPGGNTSVTTDFFAVLAYGGIFLALFYVIPTALSFIISKDMNDLALFSFLYFIVEGVMAYFIYILILSFCVSEYLVLIHKKSTRKMYKKGRELFAKG